MAIAVRLRFFAALAEAAGTRSTEIELEEGATARTAWDAACAAYPGLAALSGSLLPAVNQEYANWETPLQEGDEVAFIPPVSGGGDDPRRFRIQSEPLDIQAIAPLVQHSGAGAVVYFVGTAREWTDGRRTLRLIYDAYPEMAKREMARIESEIAERWPEARLAIHHRIGPVEIGEASVIVAVSAPRRDVAYAASRYALERLKRIVPIWKKETWEDGETWVGAQTGPDGD
ncbi:MAG TPA: molybdopterin converting factor subunit 1 [Limnochordia bacterium]